jgi:hypothetical protein
MTSDEPPHLRQFGTDVATATRNYFVYNDGSAEYLVFGIDILTATAVAWLRAITNGDRKEVEQFLQERIKIACDIAFDQATVNKALN